MKKIHLIRHAKSSRQDTALTDIARPLNKRGRKTCPVMAGHIVQAGCCFEYIFCSPAVRAQETIKSISNALNLGLRWRTVGKLYTFDSKMLFDWCGALDESVTEPLIIGHNPALTDFCNALGNTTIKNIPTCGYVQLTLKKGCSWRELRQGSAKVTAFLRPKKLMK